MDLAGYRPTLSEVAALVGKSSRWIAELRANGALPADGATLAEFMEAWTKHAAGGAKDKGSDAAMKRLTAAQADMAEMKVAQMRLELLPRPDVQLAVQSAFARVRGKMIGLPARCAPAIVSMKSVVEVQETLTELVHEALAELAETTIVPESPPAEGEVSGELAGPGAAGVDGPAVVSGAEAAASADRKPVGRRKPPAQRGGKRRGG